MEPQLELLRKTYLNLSKVLFRQLEFTDNAVGPNVVEGVGYPKISRLSPWLPKVPILKCLGSRSERALEICHKQDNHKSED